MIRLRLPAWLTPGPRRLIAACALGAFLGAALLAGGAGMSRDEATLLAPAAGLHLAPAPPELAPLATRVAFLGQAATAFGASPLRALRLPALVAIALLAGGLAFLGHRLAGRGAALLAPALLLVAPRLLDAFLTAPADALAAATGLATVLAYRRSMTARTALGRLQAALLGGAFFGAAIASRVDAVLLFPVLTAHALLAPALRRRRAAARGEPEPAPAPLPLPPGTGALRTAPRPEGPHHTPVEALRAVVASPEALEASLRGIPFALAGMLVVGPILAFALWPWLLGDPLHRPLAAVAALRGLPPDAGLAALAVHPRPWGQPALLTAYALPAALVLAYAAGLLHAGWRLVRAVRGGPGVGDELLLLLAALWPLAAAQLGFAPATPGLRPWLAAFPFLAVLAARAVIAAAQTGFPARARLAALALAAALVAPCLAAALHAWPHGGSAWGELAGGTPGAASLGLERQDGGEAAVAVLGELSRRARPGARVALCGVSPAAAAIYARAGLLRADLRVVGRPEDADLVVAALDGGPRGARDPEYQAWTALRTATPSAAAFLDEVPLAFVYARAGAWR